MKTTEKTSSRFSYGTETLPLLMNSLEKRKSASTIKSSKCSISRINRVKLRYRAYKRKNRVVMKKKDTTKKDAIIDRFWVNVTHPEALDKDGNYIPQGYVEISLEIVPSFAAKDQPNGLGRDAPN